MNRKFKMFDDKNFKNLTEVLKFGKSGLVGAIAQDSQTKIILMFAYMNREALVQTLKSGYVVYYSRSRKRLWKKGEISGQRQKLVSISTDCDKDCLLCEVIQTGVACHTGRYSCFSWQPDEYGKWNPVKPVMTKPEDLYGGK